MRRTTILPNDKPWISIPKLSKMPIYPGGISTAPEIQHITLPMVRNNSPFAKFVWNEKRDLWEIEEDGFPQGICDIV